MAYAKAKQIAVDAIPVIDIAPLFAGAEGERIVGRQLLDSVQRIGFFYIAGHGVAKAKIDRVLEASSRFFHAPRDRKETVRIADYHRGFLPIGEANKALMDRIKANKRLYTEFRATKAFEELDEEIKKYEERGK